MASTRINFTVTALDKITCPVSANGDGRVWAYDTKVPGLAYCVTEGGARTYYLYRRVVGKPSRIRIGTCIDLTVEQARRRAGELNSQIAQGIDPLAAKKAQHDAAAQKASTIENLWQSYLDGHLVPNKPKNVGWYRMVYDAHLAAWKNKPLASVTMRDVETLKGHIGKEHGHYMANRVLELLRAMYRSRGHFFGLPRRFSPTTDVEMFEEKARDRVLKPDELARFIDAVNAEDNHTVRDFFLMLLYTGARKSNVAGMRWQDISLQRREWKVPGILMKNGSPLTVPLVPEAVSILELRATQSSTDSPFVFAGKRLSSEQVEKIRALRAEGATTRQIANDLDIAQSSVMRALQPDFVIGGHKPFNGTHNAWERILERAKIGERTTIHDLRRTFGTSLIEAGAPLPYVAAAMGHRDMQTTQRHYAFASGAGVRKGVEAGVAGMLAAAQQAGEVKPSKVG